MTTSPDAITGRGEVGRPDRASLVLAGAATSIAQALSLFAIFESLAHL
jgi:hypothetical protein